MTELIESTKEIGIDTSFDDVIKMVQILVNNGYITMISKEDDMYIINYIYGRLDSFDQPYADRNEVVFMSRDTFDTKFAEVYNDEEK